MLLNENCFLILIQFDYLCNCNRVKNIDQQLKQVICLKLLFSVEYPLATMILRVCIINLKVIDFY